MEPEPILVRLGSGLGFKPVLQHVQRTRPSKQFRNYPPRREKRYAASEEPVVKA
jgi:hypothetical protein